MAKVRYRVGIMSVQGEFPVCMYCGQPAILMVRLLNVCLCEELDCWMQFFAEKCDEIVILEGDEP
jgi:hypothetical protein